MKETKNISVFSFFSGIGLLDLGFEDEGFEIVMVNEVHRPFLDAYIFAHEKLRLHMPKYGYFCQSIETFQEKSLLDDLRRKVKAERERGNLVMFIGGPPCPDFSIGGKNKGIAGENGRLSATYFDLIRAVKPDLFLFENVKGLFRTKKHRTFFDQQCEMLKKDKFCLNYSLHNAIDFGVGQDRYRLICIGAQEHWAQQIHEFNLDNQKTFDFEQESKATNWEYSKSQSSEFRKTKLPETLSVAYWFKKNDVLRHPNAEHHFQPRSGLAKFKVIEEGDCSRKSFKRLERSWYSPTAAYGNNEVHIHPTLPRRISAAEALSIQSAPKEFELPATMTLTNMFKAIGNAVPYLMAKAIAREIKSLFLSESALRLSAAK